MDPPFLFPEKDQSSVSHLNHSECACIPWIITSTHSLGGLSTPRENYHLSLSWGIITLLERIITSQYPGGLSTPREDYHLSLSWGIIIPLERIITSHYPGGLSPPREDYDLPFPFLFVLFVCLFLFSAL